MIASTWQPNALGVTPRGRYVNPRSGDGGVGASAQASDDGKTVVVRLTNMGMSAATVELVVPGFSGGASKPVTWTLQSVGYDGKVDTDGANPPADPTKISPQKGGADIGIGQGVANKGGDRVPVPAFSYIVVEYKL